MAWQSSFSPPSLEVSDLPDAVWRFRRDENSPSSSSPGLFRETAYLERGRPGLLLLCVRERPLLPRDNVPFFFVSHVSTRRCVYFGDTLSFPPFFECAFISNANPFFAKSV